MNPREDNRGGTKEQQHKEKEKTNSSLRILCKYVFGEVEQ